MLYRSEYGGLLLVAYWQSEEVGEFMLMVHPCNSPKENAELSPL